LRQQNNGADDSKRKRLKQKNLARKLRLSREIEMGRFDFKFLGGERLSRSSVGLRGMGFLDDASPSLAIYLPP
jgi:hypothetical protein